MKVAVSRPHFVTHDAIPPGAGPGAWGSLAQGPGFEAQGLGPGDWGPGPGAQGPQPWVWRSEPGAQDSRLQYKFRTWW